MGNGSSSSSSRHSTYPGQRGSGGHHASRPAHQQTVVPGSRVPASTTTTARRTSEQSRAGQQQNAASASGGQQQRRSYTTTTTTHHVPAPGNARGSGSTITSSSSTSSAGATPPTAASNPAGGSGSGPGSGSSAPISAQTISAPGAYSISRNDAGPTQVFRVQVPPSVRPNAEFQVYAGSRVVRVRCPPDVRPGQSLQITVPPDPVIRQNLLGMAQLTSVEGEGGGGAVRMSQEVEAVNRTVLEAEEAARLARLALNSSGGAPEPQDDDEDGEGVEDDQSESAPSTQQQSQSSAPPAPPQPPAQPQAYMVTVPAGVTPGSNFRVLVEGQELMVQCPPTARPGTQVRIVPPQPMQQQTPSSSLPPPVPSSQHGIAGSGGAPPGSVEGITAGTSLDRPPQQQQPSAPPPPRPRLTTQMFEVIVPPGVRPNQPFALLAGGQRVLVTCPPSAVPGQKIRFQLPVASPSTKNIESVKLSYNIEEKDKGWTRTIRVTDMKFQWVRMDEKGDVDLNRRFDVGRSAYVRRLVFLEGNDPRMRTGVLGLVPASEAAVDSKVVVNGKEIAGYADIVDAQGKPFDDKARWFHDTVGRLTVDWNEGHMRINVRRQALLTDSLAAVMSLSRHDLRKIWRFEFMGETGVDAGGLAREWFQLVTEQIFDADSGLWLSTSGNNQMSMRINPASEISCPEDHLVYFRFLGRVMGKALFDRQLVAGHMVRHMYKHILGWPITFEDLELVDEESYKNLRGLVDMDPDQIEYLCLDFTTTEETLGVKKDVELCPDGSNVEVTKDNLPEYLEARLRYSMLDRTKPQMTELLLGFFDVIPEPLLTVFDFQELELLMCGMPTIDVDDWMANTLYTGEFDGTSAARRTALPKACQWFWEVVRNDFDQEMRARLLQFVTGTSGVPSRGFSVLQGNDGNIKKFTIHGVDPKAFHYPRAHTCFNRIDLPTYSSKKDLLEKLKIAVTTSATGFDIE